MTSKKQQARSPLDKLSAKATDKKLTDSRDLIRLKLKPPLFRFKETSLSLECLLTPAQTQTEYTITSVDTPTSWVNSWGETICCFRRSRPLPMWLSMPHPTSQHRLWWDSGPYNASTSPQPHLHVHLILFQIHSPSNHTALPNDSVVRLNMALMMWRRLPVRICYISPIWRSRLDLDTDLNFDFESTLQSDRIHRIIAINSCFVNRACK